MTLRKAIVSFTLCALASMALFLPVASAHTKPTRVKQAMVKKVVVKHRTPVRHPRPVTTTPSTIQNALATALLVLA